MIGSGVGLVLQAVQQGITTFTGDLGTYVPMLFGTWPQDEQDEITAYFTKTTPPVFVSVAYQIADERLPSLAVTMEPGSEDASADAFGMLQQMVPVEDSTGTITSWQRWLGITQTDRYDCTLRHGWNQKLLLWLDIVVEWALLQQRQNLIAQGFGRQVLSRSGLEAEELFTAVGSTPVYRRVVSLTVRHQVMWYDSLQPVSAVTSEVQPAAQGA